MDGADLSGEIVEGLEADLAWKKLCESNPQGTLIDNFLIALPFDADEAAAVLADHGNHAADAGLALVPEPKPEPEPEGEVVHSVAAGFQLGKKERLPHQMLQPQTLLAGVKLEYSAHKLTPMLTRTLKEWGKNTIGDHAAAASGKTFADVVANCIAIPTWQPSHLDLSVYPSAEVSKERDRLFVRLKEFSAIVHAALTAEGYWFDVSCPATGYCLHGERGGCTWNELEGLTQLLRYGHIPAGCCGIVLHPRVRARPGRLRT
jgi:hypothetical protein